jgi:hypothetical protein
MNWTTLDVWRWEESIDVKKQPKQTDKTRGFDPCVERGYKRRKWYGVHNGNEEAGRRRAVQVRFRMRAKQLLIKCDELSIVPHDYKTYGWETW